MDLSTPVTLKLGTLLIVWLGSFVGAFIGAYCATRWVNR